MLNLVANGPSGYNLTNSLRFRGSASAYLSRTPASAGNRTTWTWSGWVKRGTLSTASSQTIFGCSTGGSSPNFECRFATQDTFDIYDNSGSIQWRLTTTQVFRDPSAWYHIVVAFDSTQATSSNRVKIYVNGTQITAFGTATYPTQNYNSYWNSTLAAGIGLSVGDQFDGYLTEVNFIDGQALTPSSFGSTNSTTGVWQPAKYTGTYGTNGFYLNFTNIALTSGSNTGLGKDFSSNGNYWNTNNISVTSGTTYDAMLDVPTNTSATVANYCTLNPVDAITATTSNANLTFNASSSVSSQFIRGTMQIPTTGKWYWEATLVSNATCAIGITVSSVPLVIGGSTTYNNTIDYQSADGNKNVNGTVSAYGATYTNGDVIGVAVDSNAGTITFYKNNTSQGAISITISNGYSPDIRGYSSTVVSANFGQRPFSYTPPTGYVALNTYNLPTPTILQGNKYMDATLYTGTGSAATITNAGGFKPDFVWAKARSSAESHRLEDSVRGATQALYSNLTNAETTEAQSITSFNSNGFSLGTGTPNTSAVTYVGWQWQAGQGSSSSNTNGSITSTVSVNTTAGFSVVTYTGTGSNATVGHGLGVAASMIIIKKRNTTDDWGVYHSALGNTKSIRLNTTAASDTNVNYWNNTSPTSSVFTIGTNWLVNKSADTYVAYCWAEIAGFSKFGSYVANNTNDGPFVYLGFRPKFLIIKCSTLGTAYTSWQMIDTSREPYNVNTATLWANANYAEGARGNGGAVVDVNNIDLLSNGFKIRNTSTENNGASDTYIYAAFAENPFRNSLAR